MKIYKGDFVFMARFHDGQEIDRSTHSTNYTEFAVKKKSEGPVLTTKLLLILAYIVVVVLAFVALGSGGVGMYLGVVFFLGVIILVYFTWPLTNHEYEYVTESGDITFTTIIAGGRIRKETLKLKIKDCEIIAPYTSEKYSDYANITKKYDFRKSVKDTDDIYFAVINEKDAKAMVIFQCTNKALKIFKSYNKENTVSVDTLRY
jgi:hypothetical protein